MSNRDVHIGPVTLTSGREPVPQTMVSHKINTPECWAEVQLAYDFGCRIIRVAVISEDEAKGLPAFFAQFQERFPLAGLVVDTHYSHQMALDVAPHCHKVRINPGNQLKHADTPEKLQTVIQPLVEVCQNHGTAVRVGINHGSLSDRILESHGNTPKGMCESAWEVCDVLDDLDFKNYLVSLKSSDPWVTLEANRLFKTRYADSSMPLLHVGVTEAGFGDEARVRSALAIVPLIQKGLAATIRTSLTEGVLDELKFCQELLTPSSSKLLQRIYTLDIDALLGSKDRQDLDVSDSIDRIILQEAGIEFTETRFISCPSCSRTQFDLQLVSGIVRERFSGHPGVTFGVMGCNVNGPGELAGAEYGFVGTGKDLFDVYYLGDVKLRNVSLPAAMDYVASILENTPVI